MQGLYAMDMTKVMFGANAIHVPAWMVVQNQQVATMFAGASLDLALTYNTGKLQVPSYLCLFW